MDWTGEDETALQAMLERRRVAKMTPREQTRELIATKLQTALQMRRSEAHSVAQLLIEQAHDIRVLLAPHDERIAKEEA